MKYTKLGLVNTNDMFRDAMEQKYAVPAFNFYNMETFQAIMDAARTTHSPVILAVSEAALKYMSPEMLTAMIRAANISPDDKIALHLDHGSTFEACAHAIKIGFVHPITNEYLEFSSDLPDYFEEQLRKLRMRG